MTTAYAANNAAYIAGESIPNIICTPFGSAFFSHTGSGITGGLLFPSHGVVSLHGHQ